MREIDIRQAAVAVAAGSAVVDVREPGEYVEGHVPSAVNIPMGRLTARLDELDRTAPVYLVCASGNRSSAMVHVLAAAGFEAVNVAGGTAAWVRAGLALETGARR